jgi:hypothetical protein
MLFVPLVVLLLIGFAILELRPLAGTSNAGTETGQAYSGTSAPFNESEIQTFLKAHITKFEELKWGLVVNDYTGNAVVTWGGEASPYGGTYFGRDNILQLFQAVVSTSTQLSIEESNFVARPTSTTSVVDANATLFLQGNSTTLGLFNGNINAWYQFVYFGGDWLISQETWIFRTFNTQFSGGATTFPQWQLVGPPVAQHYSESPFKNFVYFYGGTIAVLAIVCYVASLPVVVWLKSRDGRKRKSETQAP